MRAETHESKRPLRSGYSTGACATAASLAAARLLLEDRAPAVVTIDLPRDRQVSFELCRCERVDGDARAGVVKDAGDDPDVTHGATVTARVGLASEPGVRFHAGEGVGVVTLAGLPVAVGEPAINPVPRQMICGHLLRLAARCDYRGGFDVTIGVENGRELALKTMNPRLGIVGGLSILGTTGIVRPFSCAAYIASIHQGIDVARANGLDHIAACTGSTSEAAARRELGLADIALVEMGDFAGAVLKYLRRKPVPRLTIVGGFGKISKLAAGNTDLHSRKSAIDFAALAAWAVELGAEAELSARISAANTSAEALMLARQQQLQLGNKVCVQARAVVAAVVGNVVKIGVMAVDRSGEVVGNAGPR